MLIYKFQIKHLPHYILKRFRFTTSFTLHNLHYIKHMSICMAIKALNPRNLLKYIIKNKILRKMFLNIIF